jgi:phosphatidylglycerophosphatase A
LLLPALLPPGGFQWWMLIAGFALFRLFDVWKPWPIRWLDRRVKGGFGVMIDDVIAGILAAVVLALGLRFLG